MARHRFEGRIRVEKRIHDPSDKRKLAIASFLMDKEKVTRNYISKNASIRSQDDTKLKILLDEMIEMKWLGKDVQGHGGGVMELYYITDEGRSAVNQVKELLHSNHPLSRLGLFSEMI